MSAYSMPLCTILTKWPAPSGADVGAAGYAVDVRGDLLQQRAEGVVGLVGPPGMIDGPVQRALLAAGDARADEVQPPSRRAFSRRMVSV